MASDIDSNYLLAGIAELWTEQMLSRPQMNSPSLGCLHYHGDIFRLQFGSVSNTMWNRYLVERWGPQGVYVTVPIKERIRTIELYLLFNIASYHGQLGDETS